MIFARPPLIPSDSLNSSTKVSNLYTLSNLTLPIYSSTDNILNPSLGMLIFNNTTNTLEIYNGSIWQIISATGNWTQQGPKLVGTGFVGTDIEQGYSVSLSGDGNTLAIGGPYDDNSDTTYIGATWIFTRTTGVWTQQGPKLVGTGYVGTDIEQGTSLSLSADGNTLAIGGPYDNSDTNYIGATWIFTN